MTEDAGAAQRQFCEGCPDHEACSTGYPCAVVKAAAPREVLCGSALPQIHGDRICDQQAVHDGDHGDWDLQWREYQSVPGTTRGRSASSVQCLRDDVHGGHSHGPLGRLHCTGYEGVR